MALPFILYNNLFFGQTITATDTDASTDFDPANIKDYRTYTFWKGASSGTKYLTSDLGSSQAVDTFAFIGHNFNTATATISLEYSNDNFSGDINVAVAGFIPTDDFSQVKTFVSISERYWRIKIVSASVPAFLAAAFIGTKMEFPTKPKAPFTPRSISVQSETLESKGAHLLGSTILNKPYSLSPSFIAPGISFIANTYQAFWENHASERLPFFWMLDIDESTNVPLYVRATNRANFALILNDYTRTERLTIPMQGVLEE